MQTVYGLAHTDYPNLSLKGHAMNVGQDLRERRHAKGLTQGQLSRLADMDTPRLSEIERGVTTDPRASTLTKLYRALGVTLPWDTDSPKPSYRSGKRKRLVGPQQMPTLAVASSA